MATFEWDLDSIASSDERDYPVLLCTAYA